ncbi:helix-turn-helix transcriptional regulator [Candidatus Poriferisocius sp.]|uniref:helix-turn-helix transcriptional regulator n=1 Tax=Candidatus Poriferisocius sp. TaxID=3101276 RepID=UPI003B5180FC
MEADAREIHEILSTRRQVEARGGLSTSSIYRFMRYGLFPNPVRVGRRAVRWHVSETDAWVSSRPRAAGGRPAARATGYPCRIPALVPQEAAKGWAVGWAGSGSRQRGGSRIWA